MFFKKKCPTCGVKNPKENMTCKSCGAPLELGRGEGRATGEEARVKRQFGTRIDSEKLCLAINQVVFAASSDSSKKVLTGIMAEFDGDELTLAAADGFRLAVHKTSLSEPVGNKEAIIIPVADLQELS